MEHIIKLPASTKLLLLICTAILLTACGSEDPVSSFNANPVATVDTAATDEDSNVTTTDVRLNDTDTDGDTLTVITGNPAAFSGTVINNNNGTFTYTPNAHFNGSDRFNYTLSDNNGGRAIGTVNITVNPVNDGPIANNDVAGTNEDTNVTTADVRLNDTDIDGDILMVAAGDPVATNGTVVNNSNGTFTYTPNTNFSGSDNFSYTLSDSNGGSATGTVDITITAVNDNPVANADMATTDEDTGVTTIDVRLNDTDIESDLLTATLLTNAADGIVLDNNDGTFTYTPDTNFNGSDSFTYTLSDGNGGSTTGNVNITINTINDTPVATNDAFTTDANTPITSGDLTTNDMDVDGDTLTATLLVNASNGNVVDNNNNTFSYTPNANFDGSDNFTYTLSDGNGGSATGIVSVTINPIPPFTAAAATLTFDTKIFRFDWIDVSDATHYKLLENPDGTSGFTQVGADIAQGTQAIDHIITLYKRVNASYILQSCNLTGCTNDTTINVTSTIANAIGYFKASNTGTDDNFGTAVSLSDDGNTLAIGASLEDSSTTGIDTTANELAADSGAVYIFTNNANTWSQQAYIKAHNTDAGDKFGSTVSLSSNGDTLAVGALNESSDAIGINGIDNNNSLSSGAAYVFTRTASTWSQVAYIKASNPDADDLFGISVSLSDSGNTLAIGAMMEDSDSTGINTVPNNTIQGTNSGASYVFTRAGTSWSQQAYIKASNTGRLDFFGIANSLSADGNTLAIGATGEASNATGINGLDSNNDAGFSGAVYIFTRDINSIWSQQAYIKASNTAAGDLFALSVNLSANGNTLAIGATGEASNATGINGLESNNDAGFSGAVYIFTRDINSIWSQQAYIKASNTEGSDNFGIAVNFSADGNMLAVGATKENSNATGINSTQTNGALDAGAVYLFNRSGTNWSQTAYLKANNTGSTDEFGQSVSFSSDGNTLAIGAHLEAGSSTGINGTDNNDANKSGAVYLY